MTLEEVTHRDDRAIDSADASRLWAGQCSSYKVQKRIVCKNQRMVTARLTASVLRDETGEPLYGLATLEETSGLADFDSRCAEARSDGNCCRKWPRMACGIGSPARMRCIGRRN